MDQLVQECASLTDMDAYEFFTKLTERGLSQAEIIEFFVKLPISTANQEVYDLYMNDALDVYAETAPEGVVYGGYEWTLGDGTEITGTYTGNTNLKMAYTDYMPVEDGSIGDPKKTIRLAWSASAQSTHGWAISMIRLNMKPAAMKILSWCGWITDWTLTAATTPSKC